MKGGEAKGKKGVGKIERMDPNRRKAYSAFGN